MPDSSPRSFNLKESVTILVVDDEQMMRSLLQKILEREGYRVLPVSTASEAVDTMASAEVDIVISDLKMPGMDGFELLKQIKADHPDVGVIIMTAYGETYTVKDALLLGADEYITKPFKSHEISLVVERAYWRILSTRNRATHTSTRE